MCGRGFSRHHLLILSFHKGNINDNPFFNQAKGGWSRGFHQGTGFGPIKEPWRHAAGQANLRSPPSEDRTMPLYFHRVRIGWQSSIDTSLRRLSMGATVLPGGQVRGNSLAPSRAVIQDHRMEMRQSPRVLAWRRTELSTSQFLESRIVDPGKHRSPPPPKS